MELLLLLGVVGVMAKVASVDGQRPLVWAGITLALCGVCWFIPVPYIRFVIALIISFLSMFVYKIVADRP